MKNAQHKIIPPVYFFLAILVMAALHYWFPVYQFIHPPLSYSGTLLILAGFIIVLWSAFLFNTAGTPIRPFEESTQLVSAGMYRYTRNPMYLGMVLILLGIAILLGSLSPFILIPIFILLIQLLFIVHEESMLEERFGDEYRLFKQKVRRWL
jgi:protein-S-isoprenylcysteine O-methyltransferase Ste14